MNAAEDADLLGVGSGVLKLIALVLPVLGTSYLMVSISRRAVRSTLPKTADRPRAARPGDVRR